MFRGSRLAANFLLFLNGTAVLAIALLVAPGRAAPVVVGLLVAFGIAHVVAIVGVSRARAWGGSLALLIAQIGAGLAFVGIVAVVIGVPVLEPGALAADLPGLLAWMAALYLLLGLAVARVPGFASAVLPRPNLPFAPA
jgi:hypothetical protein